MFYDEVSKGYQYLMRLFKEKIDGASTFNAAPGCELKVKNLMEEIKLKYNYLNIRKSVHDKNSKCFFIDKMVEDSLLNVQHDASQNYAKSIKLPFPFIFFELEEPINLNLEKLLMVDEERINRKIKGLSFVRAPSLIEKGMPFRGFGESKEKDIENCFEILLHYTGIKDGFETVTFNVDTLPCFFFSSQCKYLIIDYRDNSIIDITGHGEADQRPYSGREWMPKMDEIARDLNGEHVPLIRLIDLCINLINYINAQNVTIIRKEREKNGPQQMESINRKRIKQGKVPFVPLRPYYMIEVRKHVYVNEDEDEGQEKAWELNYRVWVRGHFRHYKDGATTWIEPHVRGPSEAPWKHNRYEVLYKRFRHLLKNPKYKSP